MESHRQLRPLYVLKSVLLLLGVFGSVTIGFPSAVLGMAGVLGLLALADANYPSILRAGLLCFFIPGGIWGVTALCGLWRNSRLPKQFDTRRLLAVLTAAAVVAAVLGAVLRIPISG
jgi:hypothetical protein